MQPDVLVPNMCPEPDGADRPCAQSPRNSHVIGNSRFSERRENDPGHKVQGAQEQHGPKPS